MLHHAQPAGQAGACEVADAAGVGDPRAACSIEQAEPARRSRRGGADSAADIVLIV